MATEVGSDKSNGIAATSRISKRGFASLDPARQKEIASMGGKAAHKSGNAHQFDSAEARAAGQKSRGSKANRPEGPTVNGATDAASKEDKR